MSVKVSVIMPVYKVEDYVAKAILSIQAQTLTDWEFLIVDDGTPDRSGEICDAFAAKDSRIQVIHKENGGAPSARNTAMDIATGKYLYFMDSDDWAEPTMLADMVELAERDSAQLVIAGFFIDTYYNEDEKLTHNYYVSDETYGNSQAFREHAAGLFDKNQLYSPWNKLFLRAYIEENHLRFPGTFWDDFPFVLSVIADIERVSVTHKQYYHFIRKRAESETAAYRPNMYEKREEEHQWMVNLYKKWGIDDYTCKEMIARRYVERFVGCIENLTNKNCTMSYGEKRKLVKEMLKKPQVKVCTKLMKPGSKYMALMVLPIKWGNVTLTLLEGTVISFIKSRNTKVFANLKAKR
jgi:glycosyltransferase EpsJ